MTKCGCGSACNCGPNSCSCNHDVAPMNQNEGCKCGNDCKCDPCTC